MDSKIRNIVVKVTNECNLSCKYCYYKSCSDKASMDLATLGNLLNQIGKCDEKYINFIWHGGEPLLVGIDYYRHIIELQESISVKRIRNQIQTNGILLDKDYIDFFCKNYFELGISLDAPLSISAKGRFSEEKDGGLYNKLLININELHEANIQFGVISVLNKELLDSSNFNIIYNFFEKHIKPSTVTYHLDFEIGNSKNNRYYNAIKEFYGQSAKLS